MRAWYLGKVTDPREPSKLVEVDLESLKGLGVECFKFDADSPELDKSYEKLKQERGYSYQDVVTISRKLTADYDNVILRFFREHIHNDSEIRFVNLAVATVSINFRAILDGEGYFDVRDENENWIRLEAKKGDLLVMPAGIYHRFIPTLTDYIKAIRLFIGSPIWTAIYRDTDEAVIANMKVRKNYLSRRKPVKSQNTYYRDTDEARIDQLASRQRYLQRYGKVEN